MSAAGSWLLSGLTVVLAFAVLGPFAAIVAGYFLISPDPIASTGRGAGAGAVGAGLAAAGDHLAQEWKRGGPARQRRRSDRRDRWWAAGGVRGRALRAEHGLVLAARGVRSFFGAVIHGLAAAPVGAKAGAQAAREHRKAKAERTHAVSDRPEQDATTQSPSRRGRHRRDDRSDPTSGQPLTSGAPAASGPAAPAEGQPAAQGSGDGAAQPASQPAASTDTAGGPQDSGAQSGTGENSSTPTEGENVTETTQPTDSTPGTDGTDAVGEIGTTELATTADLREEVSQMKTVLEEASGYAELIFDYQGAVVDAYNNGEVKTRALTEGITEFVEAGEDGDKISEALVGMRVACDQADGLGEVADSMGAQGQTRAYAMP